MRYGRPRTGCAERCVDVRFIFATNKDLEKEVEAGRFHDAFYHRIDRKSVV